MFKQFISLLLLIVLLVPINSYAFQDAEYSWYKDSITTLSNEKIINGYSDGTFGPNNPITRAEILKILFWANNTKLNPPSNIACFQDVDTKMWYHTYACSAQDLSIAKWFEDGNFKPNASVTVLEALAFWVRTFGIEIPQSASGTLWYEPMRTFADSNNIVDMSRYTLDTPITRWLASDMILRLRSYKQNPAQLSFASAGCSNTSSTNLAINNTITINGHERSYILSVPSGYTREKQYRLIVASHGRTNSNEQVRWYMWLEKGQNDTIIVYPAAIKAPKWWYSWTEAENITFIDAILQQVSHNYCIDRSQVFAVGHSLGGWFTHKLTCLRGDVFRGMSAVGSSGYIGSCTGPMASIIYQRSDDKLSPYSGWESARDAKRERNLCSKESEKIILSGLSCQKWSCSPGNPIVWCEDYTTYANDAHSWPTTNAKGIFEFFNELP